MFVAQYYPPKVNIALLISSPESCVATLCMIDVGQGTTNSNPRFKRSLTPLPSCVKGDSRHFPFTPCLLLDFGLATHHTTRYVYHHGKTLGTYIDTFSPSSHTLTPHHP